MDSTSTTSLEATPDSGIAAAAAIKVKGRLHDIVANADVDRSPIEFVQGTQRVTDRTKQDGSFSVNLPTSGQWTVQPDSQPEAGTFYAFAPVTITAGAGTTNLGVVDVQGDPVANAKMLKAYVSNVLLACEDIFSCRVGKIPQGAFNEKAVIAEAAYTADLIKRALHHLVNGVPIPPDQQLCCDPSAELRMEVDGLVAPGAGTPSGGFTAPSPGYACSTCQRLYGSNLAKLQQCICCPYSCV